MKKLHRLSLILALALYCFIFVVPNLALAQGSGYNITAYHTDITIGEDNTYHVTETITVEFDTPSHGIYRTIPYKQQMRWDLAGGAQTATYNTKIKSVTVQGDQFKQYKENGNLVLQIGNPDQYVTGSKTYVISYDHVLGDDKIDSQDFIYYNLIGTEWDCTINNVTFSVTLPKSFDASKIWFFTGAFGSSTENAVNYSINGNTISGSLDARLSAGEGLTLQADLPQGYFDVPPPFPWQAVLMLTALLLAVIALILFFLFGRDGVLVTPVEFYAPEGVTSAEAGYIIDTTADDKDVISLLIYWASKGYLSITQLDTTGEDDFTLEKLKELGPEAKNFEKKMFYEIFKDGNQINISELKYKFYATMASTKQLIATYYSKKENLLYSTRSQALGWMVQLFSMLLVWVSLLVTIYAQYYTLGIPILFSAAGTLVAFLPLFIIKSAIKRWAGLRTGKRVFMLAAGIILTAAFMAAYVAFMLLRNMFAAGLVIAVASIFISVLSGFMRKRTKLGSDLLGRLLGYKDFIEHAEKSRIERLVDENPSYFFDVLPFAYVLGVSDKWAKKFEGIAINPPNWYYGYRYNTFSPILFQAAIFHSMASMRNAMIAQPAGQNRPFGVGSGGTGGGGFGGGGFSGGGFGGGGGGRW